jgi:hypothetical protein
MASDDEIPEVLQTESFLHHQRDSRKGLEILEIFRDDASCRKYGIIGCDQTLWAMNFLIL